jgi:hypothetical protein
MHLQSKNSITKAAQGEPPLLPPQSKSAKTLHKQAPQIQKVEEYSRVPRRHLLLHLKHNNTSSFKMVQNRWNKQQSGPFPTKGSEQIMSTCKHKRD